MTYAGHSDSVNAVCAGGGRVYTASSDRTVGATPSRGPCPLQHRECASDPLSLSLSLSLAAPGVGGGLRRFPPSLLRPHRRRENRLPPCQRDRIALWRRGRRGSLLGHRDRSVQPRFRGPLFPGLFRRGAPRLGLHRVVGLLRAAVEGGRGVRSVLLGGSSAVGAQSDVEPGGVSAPSLWLGA